MDKDVKNLTVSFINTVTELIFFGLFGLNLYFFRKDKKEIKLLAALIIYGILLEAVTIQQLNTYKYGNFNIMLFGTPLWIGTSWAVIIFSSMKITSAVFDDTPLLSFMVGLLTVSVDFIMDPIAVHIGFWEWGTMRNMCAGVPYGNFIAWFIVGFVFSFIFRYFKNEKVPERYLYPSSVLVSLTIVYLLDFLKNIEFLDSLTDIALLLIILFSLMVCALGCKSKNVKFNISLIMSMISLMVFYIYFIVLYIIFW